MVNISVNFIIVYCVKLFLSLLMLYGLTYKASHLFHDRRSCMLPAPVPVQCLLGRLVRHLCQSRALPLLWIHAQPRDPLSH